MEIDLFLHQTVIVKGTTSDNFCQYSRIGKSIRRAVLPSIEQCGNMAIQLVVVVVLEAPC